MDIKNVFHSILPLNLKGKAQPVERDIKMGNTTDRDANGQQAFGDGQPDQGPMSDEQFQKAMEHIRALPAVKEHNLIVEKLEAEGKKFVLLKQPDGKLFRRIAESELWSLMQTTEKEKGQLLRKTA